MHVRLAGEPIPIVISTVAFGVRLAVVPAVTHRGWTSPWLRVQLWAGRCAHAVYVAGVMARPASIWPMEHVK